MSENPNNNDDNLPPAKRLKTEESVGSVAPRSSVQDALAKAKEQLAKRQAQNSTNPVSSSVATTHSANVGTIAVSSTPLVSTTAAASNAAAAASTSTSTDTNNGAPSKLSAIQEAVNLAKQAREKALQSSKAAQSSVSTRKTVFVESMDTVVVAGFDREGHPLDHLGNIIELVKKKPVMPVTKPVAPVVPKEPVVESVESNHYFDPVLGSNSSRKKAKIGQTAAGDLAQRALRDKLRHSETLLQHAAAENKMWTQSVLASTCKPVEPWDEVLSKQQFGKQGTELSVLAAATTTTRTSLDSELTERHIQGLGFMYVPRRVAPVVVENHVKPQKLQLTKQEQKKSSRQARLKKEQVKQDLMRAGALPTPAPRVKLSNLARVLGSGLVENPTLLQAAATQQMAARVQGHIEHNLARMLTPEERRKKLVSKYQEDVTSGVEVRVYRAGSLGSALVKAKISALCRDLYITGLALLTRQGNVIVVEGGPKALARFDALVSRRIDWATVDLQVTQEQRDTYDGFTTHTDCVAVWSGMHPARIFSAFNFHAAKSPQHARYILELLQIPQYFDSAQNHF